MYMWLVLLMRALCAIS